MWEYYEIWDIECPGRSMFQTLEDIAWVLRVPYSEFLDALGFKSNIEIKRLMLDPPTNYFSIERFLCPKINHILKTYDVPLRIVGRRPRKLCVLKN